MSADKNTLLSKLKEYTERYGVRHNECFTALHLANELDLSRNLVSQYLNEFVQQGKVVKINTRPVYFFEVSALEAAGYPILAST